MIRKGAPVWLVIVLSVLSACSTAEWTRQAGEILFAADATQIQLTQPLRFSASDGNDVLVPAGRYSVERAADRQLRLVPAGGAQGITLSAQEVIVGEELLSPSSFLVPLDGEVQQILLLGPGQSALEARGAVSAVQPRGLQQLGVDLTQPRRTNGPDLVAGCVHKDFVVNSYIYFSGVMNRGNIAAGPSQASLAGKMMPIPALQPGASQAVARTSSQPLPAYSLMLRVDTENVVAESDETNNIKGPCS